MKAYVFPGQGAQFVGMTKVTQPAVFLHSVILARTLGDDFRPDMTAGHSLGEFSALVAAGALSFEEGLKLVSARAHAMQKACEAEPSTMAAVLALSDEKVEEICSAVEGVVAPANYNCPGQVVISGAVDAVDAACVKMKEAGAKRALRLKVGGAFHSPLMQPAQEELAEAIAEAKFPSAPYIRMSTASPTPTRRRSRPISSSSLRLRCAGHRMCSLWWPTERMSSSSSVRATCSRVW